MSLMALANQRGSKDCGYKSGASTDCGPYSVSLYSDPRTCSCHKGSLACWLASSLQLPASPWNASFHSGRWACLSMALADHLLSGTASLRSGWRIVLLALLVEHSTVVASPYKWAIGKPSRTACVAGGTLSSKQPINGCMPHCLLDNRNTCHWWNHGYQWLLTQCICLHTFCSGSRLPSRKQNPHCTGTFGKLVKCFQACNKLQQTFFVRLPLQKSVDCKLQHSASWSV